MAKSSTQTPTSSAVAFIFDACRPSAGTALASYTEAWLQLSGMANGGLVPAKDLKAIMGDTAYGYHTRKGNIEKTDKGCKLTEQGEMHFAMGANRNIRPEPEMVRAYTETMSTGKPSEMVKNAAFIKALKPVAKP